jgi:ribonuclease E
MILRGIEEEGIRSRSSLINVFVPTDVAVFLLNQKRKTICDLERQYNMQIIISADDKIKNVSDYRIERVKISKQQVDAIKQNIDEYKVNTPEVEFKDFEDSSDNNTADNSSAIEIEDKPNFNKRKKERHNRRMFNRDRKSRNNKNNHDKHDDVSVKNEPVILYNSHENVDNNKSDVKTKETEGKKTWWRKLIKS